MSNDTHTRCGSRSTIASARSGAWSKIVWIRGSDAIRSASAALRSRTPDLHQCLHPAVGQHVVHHRRVRVLVPLVGHPQIRMRIDLQHPEPPAPRRRRDAAPRDRVIASDHADDLPRRELGRHELPHPLHHPLGQRVHSRRVCAGLRVPGGDRLVVGPHVQPEHPRPRQPGLGQRRVIQIELRARSPDRRRSLRRPAAVAAGRLPRHREEDHAALRLAVRQPEDAPVRIPRSVCIRTATYRRGAALRNRDGWPDRGGPAASRGTTAARR